MEITFCFFDSRPETQVHGAKDDQAPSEMKGVEDPPEHGGDRKKRPVHFPETFLKFFYGHPFRPINDRCHIIL